MFTGQKSGDRARQLWPVGGNGGDQAEQHLGRAEVGT